MSWRRPWARSPRPRKPPRPDACSWRRGGVGVRGGRGGQVLRLGLGRGVGIGRGGGGRMFRLGRRRGIGEDGVDGRSLGVPGRRRGLGGGVRGLKHEAGRRRRGRRLGEHGRVRRRHWDRRGRRHRSGHRGSWPGHRLLRRRGEGRGGGGVGIGLVDGQAGGRIGRLGLGRGGDAHIGDRRADRLGRSARGARAAAVEPEHTAADAAQDHQTEDQGDRKGAAAARRGIGIKGERPLVRIGIPRRGGHARSENLRPSLRRRGKRIINGVYRIRRACRGGRARRSRIDRRPRSRRMSPLSHR